MHYFILAMSFVANGFIWLAMSQILPTVELAYIILSMGQFLIAFVFIVIGIGEVTK